MIPLGVVISMLRPGLLIFMSNSILSPCSKGNLKTDDDSEDIVSDMGDDTDSANAEGVKIIKNNATRGKIILFFNKLSENDFYKLFKKNIIKNNLKKIK